MNQQNLRVGFVGAGNIVRQRHVPGLQQIEGIELTAVCNSTRRSSQNAAQEFGIPHVFDHWRDLVHASEIDIVWIGTWPYLHCPVTLEALQAGKHVFCQARMAMNVAEARQMLAAAQRTDRVTMLCPPPMGLKGDRAMRGLLHEENVLGRVYSIHFRAMNGHLLDPSTPISWRQREELSGLNTLTVGIYAEVIHRWFGYARTVQALEKTFHAMRPDSSGRKVPVTRPDMVMALCEMENGALMRCEWSGLATPDAGSYIEAYGSKGALRYHFDRDEIWIQRHPSEWEPVTLPENERGEWTVEHNFINAIRTGQEVHPDFYDGFKYTQFTEGVFRAVATEQSINLLLL